MKRARGMKLYVYYGKTGNYLSTRAECMKEDCLLLRPAIPNSGDYFKLQVILIYTSINFLSLDLPFPHSIL